MNSYSCQDPSILELQASYLRYLASLYDHPRIEEKAKIEQKSPEPRMNQQSKEVPVRNLVKVEEEVREIESPKEMKVNPLSTFQTMVDKMPVSGGTKTFEQMLDEQLRSSANESSQKPVQKKPFLRRKSRTIPPNLNQQVIQREKSKNTETDKTKEKTEEIEETVSKEPEDNRNTQEFTRKTNGRRKTVKFDNSPDKVMNIDKIKPKVLSIDIKHNRIIQSETNKTAASPGTNNKRLQSQKSEISVTNISERKLINSKKALKKTTEQSPTRYTMNKKLLDKNKNQESPKKPFLKRGEGQLCMHKSFSSSSPIKRRRRTLPAKGKEIKKTEMSLLNEWTQRMSGIPEDIFSKDWKLKSETFEMSRELEMEKYNTEDFLEYESFVNTPDVRKVSLSEWKDALSNTSINTFNQSSYQDRKAEGYEENEDFSSCAKEILKEISQELTSIPVQDTCSEIDMDRDRSQKAVYTVHEDGKREKTFHNGTRKVLDTDGKITVYYRNDDVKHILPNGKILYYFAESKTTQITFPDGNEYLQFASGQLEKHFVDGKKEIYFPDNTVIRIFPSGREETIFPDGSVSINTQ